MKLIIKKDNYYLKKYREIRKETIKFYLNFSKNNKDLMCKKGCAECCQTFSILPIEYYYIRLSSNTKNLSINIDRDNKCMFLKEDICQIYKYRPIICITQGLPLIFRDSEEKSAKVFICKKNKNIIKLQKGENFKAFEYDILLTKLNLLNELLCKEYKIPNKRININNILQAYI